MDSQSIHTQAPPTVIGGETRTVKPAVSVVFLEADGSKKTARIERADLTAGDQTKFDTYCGLIDTLAG